MQRQEVHKVLVRHTIRKQTKENEKRVNWDYAKYTWNSPGRACESPGVWEAHGPCKGP